MSVYRYIMLINCKRTGTRWYKIGRAGDINETIKIGDRFEIEPSMIRNSRTIRIRTFQIRKRIESNSLCFELFAHL